MKIKSILLLFLFLITALSASSSALAASSDFPDKPASYIIWWPGKSSANDASDINAEMTRMTQLYHPEYLLLWMTLIDFEPRPHQFDFTLFDSIAAAAKSRNIKLILMLTGDFYGGMGPAPFSYDSAGYQNSRSWFWKHTLSDDSTYGLYDPLIDGMRYPATCGCNCNTETCHCNNTAYGKDWSVLVGTQLTDHITTTCDGTEYVPSGATIRVSEHPDLVYSPFDSAWPGSATVNLNIHTPYPSFSSDNFRNELVNYSKNVALHIAANFSDTVWGYTIWHEPSYAHFRETTTIGGVNYMDYEVDYSQPELNKFNQWLGAKGKATVPAIPSPVTADYVRFRKENLASVLRIMKDAVTSAYQSVPAAPKPKIGTHLFMAQNSADRDAIDPRSMLDIFDPDFITEAAISANSWTDPAYSSGATVGDVYNSIKTYNTKNVPIFSSSVDIAQETHNYNTKFFIPILTHYVTIHNTDAGSSMPLIACWASRAMERDPSSGGWGSPNTIHTATDLASAYDSANSWKLTSGAIPTSMAAGTAYPLSFYVVNTGQNIWDQSKPYRLGARWYNTSGAEINQSGQPVTAANYQPLNFRAFLPSGETVYSGEQQKFTFTDLSPPTTPGTYVLKVDMVQEGVSWFNSPVTQTITVASGCTICSSAPAHNLGNANCDAQINISDFLKWKQEFTSHKSTNLTADFNCDHTINLNDFTVWRNNL